MKRLFNLKIVALNVILLCALHFTQYSASAQSISSDELINNAKLFDGKSVVYIGEVVGDIMIRGEYAWINVLDGKNAIGIWAGKDLVKDIAYMGSYKFKGDVVEVSGIFHRACLQHGGDLDLHAQSLTKIIAGRPTQETPNFKKRNIVILLLGALVLIWILTLLKRR
jgi:hypothetical protein